MNRVIYLIASLLLLPIFSALAEDFTLRAPLTLNNGEQKWVIETRYEELFSKLSYTYTQGNNVDTAWIPSDGYSDIAPSAVLVEGSPLLVWSSIESENSDSDIYFVRWEETGWGVPTRAHVDNQIADMLPELSIDLQGQVTLKWLQNVGQEVVERVAIFIDDRFELQDDVSLLESKIRLYSELVHGFYAEMEKLKPNQPLICIAYGDSITQGLKRNASDHRWGETRPVNGAQRGSYTEELRAKLSPDFKVVKVYNRGVMGQRSYDGARSINKIMSRHPDANCILIMYGANDRYQGLHPTSTREYIRSMAERARAASVIPIIATITPNTDIGGISKYNKQIKAYATQSGITLADQYSATATKWSRNHSGDGLHLNSRGDEVMAVEWNRAMRTNKLLFPEPIVISPILLLLLGD